MFLLLRFFFFLFFISIPLTALWCRLRKKRALHQLDRPSIMHPSLIWGKGGANAAGVPWQSVSLLKLDAWWVEFSDFRIFFVFFFVFNCPFGGCCCLTRTPFFIIGFPVTPFFFFFRVTFFLTISLRLLLASVRVTIWVQLLVERVFEWEGGGTLGGLFCFCLCSRKVEEGRSMKQSDRWYSVVSWIAFYLASYVEQPNVERNKKGERKNGKEQAGCECVVGKVKEEGVRLIYWKSCMDCTARERPRELDDQEGVMWPS